VAHSFEVSGKAIVGLGVAAVAAVAAVVLVFVVLVDTEGGSSETTTAAAAETMPVTTYFYLGSGLVRDVEHPSKSADRDRAALEALVAGPPGGYTTELPAGARLVDLDIADGTAHAVFSPAVARAPRAALGQIVYTLTENPSVRRVVIGAGKTDPIPLTDSAGNTIDRPATRADFTDLTPDAAIFVAEPHREASLISPIRVSGTASVYEGGLTMEVVRDGKVLHTEPITASAGAPYRGTWSTALDLDPGRYELVFYEPSAENGRHLHTTTVPIRITG